MSDEKPVEVSVTLAETKRLQDMTPEELAEEASQMHVHVGRTMRVGYISFVIGRRNNAGPPSRVMMKANDIHMVTEMEDDEYDEYFQHWFPDQYKNRPDGTPNRPTGTEVHTSSGYYVTPVPYGVFSRVLLAAADIEDESIPKEVFAQLRGTTANASGDADGGLDVSAMARDIFGALRAAAGKKEQKDE